LTKTDWATLWALLLILQKNGLGDTLGDFIINSSGHPVVAQSCIKAIKPLRSTDDDFAKKRKTKNGRIIDKRFF
jgi:hypothetical protein